MITKRYEQFNADDWIRICQECGHAQVCRCPKDYKSDTWRDLKCKKCKSDALDYGTVNASEDCDD